MGVGNRQRVAREYRGQMPSPGRPGVAWREEIALLRARDLGVRAIARRPGRSPSTVSRELRRNASTRSCPLEYRASLAQWHAERRARRPRTAKLVASPRLRDHVRDRPAGTLVHAADGRTVEGPRVAPWKGRNKPRRQDRLWATAWSPEQISQRLKADFPDDDSMRISPEAGRIPSVIANHLVNGPVRHSRMASAGVLSPRMSRGRRLS